MTFQGLTEHRALMGCSRACPLSTHSHDSTLVSCSKIETQLSSPVMILSKKCGSSWTLDKFCSLSATRWRHWFSIRMCSTNLGAILDKFMSFFNTLCTEDFDVSTSCTSWRTVFLWSTSMAAAICWLLSVLVLGRPVLDLSFTSCSPSLNCWNHIRTCVWDSTQLP